MKNENKKEIPEMIYIPENAPIITERENVFTDAELPPPPPQISILD